MHKIVFFIQRPPVFCIVAQFQNGSTYTFTSKWHKFDTGTPIFETSPPECHRSRTNFSRMHRHQPRQRRTPSPKIQTAKPHRLAVFARPYHGILGKDTKEAGGWLTRLLSCLADAHTRRSVSSSAPLFASRPRRGPSPPPCSVSPGGPLDVATVSDALPDHAASKGATSPPKPVAARCLYSAASAGLSPLRCFS